VAAVAVHLEEVSTRFSRFLWSQELVPGSNSHLTSNERSLQRGTKGKVTYWHPLKLLEQCARPVLILNTPWQPFFSDIISSHIVSTQRETYQRTTLRGAASSVGGLAITAFEEICASRYVSWG
jgi:hypothetical protein